MSAKLILLFLLAFVSASAQSAVRPPFVQAAGQTVVSVKPDQATIEFSA